MSTEEIILNLRAKTKSNGKFINKSIPVIMSSAELLVVLQVTGGVLFENKTVCYRIKHKHAANTKSFVWVERVDK